MRGIPTLTAMAVATGFRRAFPHICSYHHFTSFKGKSQEKSEWFPIRFYFIF
jgi:hypothetical protein